MIKWTGPSLSIVLAVIAALIFSMPAKAEQSPQTSVDMGKAIAINLCQACHSFDGADQAGTVGPAFAKMKQRFPEREKLRTIIYDPQKAKPHTRMPPFGRHGFVDKAQIEQLIDFIYTL